MLGDPKRLLRLERELLCFMPGVLGSCRLELSAGRDNKAGGTQLKANHW